MRLAGISSELDECKLPDWLVLGKRVVVGEKSNNVDEPKQKKEMSAGDSASLSSSVKKLENDVMF